MSKMGLPVRARENGASYFTYLLPVLSVFLIYVAHLRLDPVVFMIHVSNDVFGERANFRPFQITFSHNR